MKTSNKYLVGAIVFISIAVIIGYIAGNMHGLWLPFLVSLVAAASAVMSIVAFVVSHRHRKSETGDGPKDAGTGIVLRSVVPWILTLSLASSVAVAGPVSEASAQTDAVFKLMSVPEATYTLTPLGGGMPVSFPSETVTLDKVNGILSTPAGKFRAVKNESGVILFESSDGTQYLPNIGLCEVVVGCVIIAGTVYVGIKVYYCAKPVISNYVRNLTNTSGNAAIIVYGNSSPSQPVTAPSFASLSIAGMTHVMGPPPSIFKLPAGSSMQLSNNIGNNAYMDDLSGQNLVDPFGNQVKLENLIEIDDTNSFLVAANGQWRPCTFEVSTDMIHWSHVPIVVFSWQGMSNGVISLTTVTTTKAGLRPVSTNFCLYSGTNIVESYYSNPKGPMQFTVGSQQGYMRLGY